MMVVMALVRLRGLGVGLRFRLGGRHGSRPEAGLLRRALCGRAALGGAAPSRIDLEAAPQRTLVSRHREGRVNQRAAVEARIRNRNAAARRDTRGGTRAVDDDALAARAAANLDGPLIDDDRGAGFPAHGNVDLGAANADRRGGRLQPVIRTRTGPGDKPERAFRKPDAGARSRCVGGKHEAVDDDMRIRADHQPRLVAEADLGQPGTAGGDRVPAVDGLGFGQHARAAGPCGRCRLHDGDGFSGAFERETGARAKRRE